MIFEASGLAAHLQNLEQTNAKLKSLMAAELSKVTDRHLARVVENTPVGDSPDSPDLRNKWDRSGVVGTRSGVESEVFNTSDHASFFENGHRQTVGRLVFIELTPGARKYGRVAKEYKGKWGIFLRLKKPFVRGRFVLLDSEKLVIAELEACSKRILEVFKNC